MKALLKLSAIALALAVSAVSHAGPYPQKPKAAKKDNTGRWVPVDEDDPETADKSENALEIYQLLREGKADLQLDVTSWDPPAPQNVPQAIHALRYGQNARNIKFENGSVTDFALEGPKTVEAALVSLAKKQATADRVKLPSVNLVHYGLERPVTVSEALAILVARIYVLEAQVAALTPP